MRALYSWNVLVYKLEAFKICQKVKQSMSVIAAIIYIFLFYVIFHQQLKTTLRKCLALP